MATRLMVLGASRGCFEAACNECPTFRAVAVTREAARRMFDRHRAEAHPRQATYVASKRRARA